MAATAPSPTSSSPHDESQIPAVAPGAPMPPGPRAPRAVQTAMWGTAPVDHLLRLKRRYGPVFTMRVYPYEGLVCATDAPTNREVLTDGARFVAGPAASLIAPITGDGSLITLAAPRHLRERKLLLPPFHGEAVASWQDRIAEMVEPRVRDLPADEPTAMRPWAQRLTMDVILRVVFGLEDPARVAAFRDALERWLTPAAINSLWLRPLMQDYGPLSPGGRFWRNRARVDGLIFAEIARRRSGGSEADDVLTVLLGARHEDGSALTDDQLRDHLLGMLVAGHETTATAIAWSTSMLAHHPAVRDELGADPDPALLDAVIREVMRLRPPVIDAIRHARADTELGGRPVPAGALVSAMFCATHVDPDLWDEPLAFRPRRHLEGKPAPYAWTPFGGGVRRCIGASLAQLELDVVLRALLAARVPQAAGAAPRIRLHGITLVPSEGGRVVLARR